MGKTINAKMPMEMTISISEIPDWLRRWGSVIPRISHHCPLNQYWPLPVFIQLYRLGRPVLKEPHPEAFKKSLQF